MNDELELYEEHFDDYATKFPGQHVQICGQQCLASFRLIVKRSTRDTA